MRKSTIFAAAIAVLFAVPASATDFGFGAAGLGFGLGGVGASVSGAGNLSGAFQTGSSTASASSQSFGQAESGFGVGIGTLPNGTSAPSAFGNFIGANVASGSQSNASTTANGNGFSAAGSIGAGFGGTALVGGAGALGGYVSN